MTLKIEHRVGLQVPASIVWEIISDVSSWPAWTQIYPKAAGKIGFGERLVLTLALPGEPHREIAPVIIDWTPDEAIHWRTSLVGGLGWSVRYLEIEVLSETGCVFSNGELFGGLAGPMAARGMRRSLRRGFTALGEALKDRAESLWRERSGEAT